MRELIFDGAIAAKASPYEGLSSAEDHLFDYEREPIRALAGDVRELDVLNVGGDPAHREWLTSHGARTVGIDPNEHDLREALPLGKESFDLVFSSLTLHFVREWEPLMREFHRVTRPNGALVFSTHHPCRGLHDGLGVDYFSTGLVVDRCNSSDEDVRLRYWRRPLSAVVSAVIETGWRIAKIAEPRIAEAVDPWFLIVRATR